MLKDILQRYIERITKELLGTSQLISLKVLYPCDTKQSALRSLLVLDKSVEEEDYFIRLEKSFVEDNKRSLSFLKYDDPVLHGSIIPAPGGEVTYSGEYNYIVDNWIPLTEEDIDKFSVEGNLEDYWETWKNTISTSFGHGKLTLWSYVVLPRIINGTEKQFIASAFLIFSEIIDKKTAILINKYCQDLLIECITSTFYDELTVSATRAAIAQVMARNTSHNIGAHVMNKLIGSSLKETHLSKFKNYTPEVDLLSDDDKNLLTQIGYFNNYVKCRMDYLADISFGTPLMQTNKYAYRDIYKEFDKVRLLLEHISGLSDFSFRIEFLKNGEDTLEKDDLLLAVPNDILGMQAFYNILENIIRNTAKHTENKPKTTIFTVNFIDDYKKYKPRDGENKEEIENILNDYIAVEVYDNIPIAGDDVPLAGEKKDEYVRHVNFESKVIEDLQAEGSVLKVSKIDWLVYSQNENINKDLLEDNNKLRASALGVIEMDASAAYLRKRDVGHINHPNYEILHNESWSCKSNRERGVNCRNFLKAFKKELVSATFIVSGERNEERKYALGYRFFMLRPEVVLVVTTELSHDKEKKDKLKKQGIWVVTPDEFRNHLEEKKKSYNHEFVLIDKGVEFIPVDKTDFLEYYNTSLPLRILQIAANENGNIKDVARLLEKVYSDSDEKNWLNIFEGFCWEKWNKEVLNLEYVRKGQSPTPSKNGKASTLADHEFPDNINDLDKSFYYDPLSSNAQQKLPKFNNDLTAYITDVVCTDAVVKMKIGESIISNILVIDERIQENSEIQLSSNNHILIKNVYSKTGIIMPDRDNIRLGGSDIDTKAIEDFIYKYIRTSFKTADIELLNRKHDFILIHYSILERMYKSDRKIISQKLKEWSDCVNIVVTSGRGEPEDLPQNVRFINLSSVIHGLVESRSKYFMNYILHSSRKSSKTKVK